MLVEETSYDYLFGLWEEVRNLVHTQYRLKILRDLQSAALHLDPFQHLEEGKPKSESTVYSVKTDKENNHKVNSGLKKRKF